jgi:hypothetical protein
LLKALGDMGAYRDPFGGQRKAGSNKASRPKQFRKKKNDGANEDRRPSKKSPWALLGAVGSFAAVWVFTIFKVQSDSKQKTLSDKMILKTLMFKPVVYTDHAICRMKCRYYVLKMLLLFVM